MGNVTYHPRNDFVILRLVNLGKTDAGIIMPDMAAQGKEWRVVAVGPEVKELKAGDKILPPFGEVGETIITMPNEKDLYITRQSNVAVVVKTDK